VALFVSVQFPLADLRPFLDGDTGRLSSPPWPLIDPTRHFIRSIGAARERPRGGVAEWLGEGVYCDAAKMLRLEHPAAGPAGVTLRPVFRRLFVSGHPDWAGALARLDAGFRLRPNHRRHDSTYRQADPLEAAGAVLRHPVTVRGRPGEPTPLMSAGGRLARLLRYATTRTAPAVTSRDWWVQAGRPLVLIERVADASGHPYLAHHAVATFESERQRVPVWIVDYSPSANRGSVRSIRIHLWRLHQEREILRLVLAACLQKLLNPHGNRALRDYLARQSNRLRRARLDGLPQRSLLTYASTIDTLVNEQDLATLEELLDAFGPGLRFSILDLATAAATTAPREVNIYYLPNGQMTVTDNSQNVSGNANAGALIGGSATVSGGSFQGAGTQHTTWDQQAATFDLTRLAEELSQLRTALRSAATDPAHDVIVAELAQAELAATANDRPKLRDHLAKTGKWALTTATAIGTTVAAAAIKAATGL
jgi:hypothetical protein